MNNENGVTNRYPGTCFLPLNPVYIPIFLLNTREEHTKTYDVVTPREILLRYIQRNRDRSIPQVVIERKRSIKNSECREFNNPGFSFFVFYPAHLTSDLATESERFVTSRLPELYYYIHSHIYFAKLPIATKTRP